MDEHQNTLPVRFNTIELHQINGGLAPIVAQLEVSALC